MSPWAQRQRQIVTVILIMTMIVHDNSNDGHHYNVDIQQVCGIEYDFLIKFEHLSREEEYLRESLIQALSRFVLDIFP